MASAYAKIYISMPQEFLHRLDHAAETEHLSRSAFIREAVKLYMSLRTAGAEPRFFAMSEALRRRFDSVSEAELEARIDRAVERARESRGG